MASPEAALDNASSESGLLAATADFSAEVVTADRVLYAFRVGATIKEAIIVANTPTLDRGRTGWHPESWARCNYSEFPDAMVEEWGLRIWTDGNGYRAPTYELNAYAGSKHCSWESATFLVLDGITYVGNPPSDLVPGYVPAGFSRGLAVAASAHDTGYHREGKKLWTAADRKSAYVGSPTDAELWPATVKDITCA
jgi:hypothetical protein